jgi:hypothetical protein
MPQRLERFGQNLSELEVEISDDAFILKEEDARKLMEPDAAVGSSVACDLKPG